MSAADRSGEVLDGRYELLRRIAEGGMGTVYEARHRVLGRRVAVKFLRAELAEDASLRARFRREPRAVARIESQHIVSVLDWGHSGDDAPYLVMEYLSGESLRGVLDRVERVPVGRAVDLALQICHALGDVHGAGIVHRDLSPSNVFVQRRWDGGDHVKLLDFGIAKVEGATDLGLSRPGAVIGTLHYMPPEQLRGDAGLDHRADIHALGAILYELLTGRVPHPGAQQHEVMYHTLNRPHAPIEELRPGVPEGLTALLDRMLAKEPAGRPASIAEVARELSHYRAAARGVAGGEPGAEVQATRPTPVSVEVVPAAAPGSTLRGRALMLVGAASVALGLGWLGVVQQHALGVARAAGRGGAAAGASEHEAAGPRAPRVSPVVVDVAPDRCEPVADGRAEPEAGEGADRVALGPGERGADRGQRGASGDPREPPAGRSARLPSRPRVGRAADGRGAQDQAKTPARPEAPAPGQAEAEHRVMFDRVNPFADE